MANYFKDSKSFYSPSFVPKFHYEVLPNNHRIVRFDDPYQAMYYDYFDVFTQYKDEIINSKSGKLDTPTYSLYQRGKWQEGENYCDLEKYEKERFILTPEKLAIIEEAEQDIKFDKDFLNLIHNAKSEKRKFIRNKFCGNLSIVEFAKQNEKMFNKQNPGAKKKTLNILFQVGVFRGDSYKKSFIKILKTIMMCQSMGIHCNIDVCDGEVYGLNGRVSYTIVNVARSDQKINFSRLFCFYHYEFFIYTLFNSYLAPKLPYSIESFVSKETFVKDLSDRYDIIGGNQLNKEICKDQMVSQIIKIANK